jgi:hypothetical protein
MASEDMARIGLDDIIAAAGQGAVRALAARHRAASTNNGFYIEMLFRCGEPPLTLNAAALAVEEALERGPRPMGPTPGKD